MAASRHRKFARSRSHWGSRRSSVAPRTARHAVVQLSPRGVIASCASELQFGDDECGLSLRASGPCVDNGNQIDEEANCVVIAFGASGALQFPGRRSFVSSVAVRRRKRVAAK
jgi:hypothetical protein